MRFDRASLDAHKALWDKWKDDPRIVWCCPGRHGYARGIRQNEIMEFYQAMQYVFGDRCMWQKKRKVAIADGIFEVQQQVYDCEWVHMAKVSPPPKRPWEWCGKTHIFPEWQEREAEVKEHAKLFRVGDRVRFTIKSRPVHGVVVGLSKKSAKVYVDSRRETWNVGYGHIMKEVSTDE